MLVTDSQRFPARDPLTAVLAAVAGGLRLIQLRETHLDDATLGALTLRLCAELPADATVVINGRPDVASRSGCGLHLPSRACLSAGIEPPRPFGRSAHDTRAVLAARDEGADYVVLGTLYETGSKPGRPGTGAAALAEAHVAAPQLPLYGIGGVSASRVGELLRAGAHGVAVSGAILGSSRPRRAAEALLLALAVADAEESA